VNNQVFIIAEAGVNHNGNLGMAFKLVDAAVEAGANAVKFQTFTAAALVSPVTQKVAYQMDTTPHEESHFDMLKKLELSKAEHQKLFKYCIEKGIEFISTPYDIESVKFLDELGVQTYKTASADIVDLILHKFLSKTGKNVIIATGMATLGEIEEVINIYPDKNKITLLHCVSNYPCSIESLNLKVMQTLKGAFNVNVGYSDHSIGSLAATISVALGGNVVEKHFTLDKTLPGPDHKASSDFLEFSKLVDSIRATEIALGEPTKLCQAEEAEMASVSRKSIVLNKNVKKGEKITIEHIALKRPGTGLYAREIKNILNKKLRYDLPKDHILSWSDIY
jgi:N,N'-diacetyllegionaminate synthase